MSVNYSACLAVGVLVRDVVREDEQVFVATKYNEDTGESYEKRNTFKCRFVGSFDLADLDEDELEKYGLEFISDGFDEEAAIGVLLAECDEDDRVSKLTCSVEAKLQEVTKNLRKIGIDRPASLILIQCVEA